MKGYSTLPDFKYWNLFTRCVWRFYPSADNTMNIFEAPMAGLYRKLVGSMVTMLWLKKQKNKWGQWSEYVFTNPSVRAGCDTGSIFKLNLTGLNSEFSFSYTGYLTKTEEHSLSNYLPIAEGRIKGFIPFPRVLVLCEMQSASSRIWTHVTVPITYDYTLHLGYVLTIVRVYQ